jgi:hypothetical protein
MFAAPFALTLENAIFTNFRLIGSLLSGCFDNTFAAIPG